LREVIFHGGAVVSRFGDGSAFVYHLGATIGQVARAMMVAVAGFAMRITARSSKVAAGSIGEDRGLAPGAILHGDDGFGFGLRSCDYRWLVYVWLLDGAASTVYVPAFCAYRANMSHESARQ
jgi:hypothetical protein